MSSGWHIHGATVHGAGRRPMRTKVFIEGSRIASIGTAPKNFTADRKVDAHGLHLMPMLNDRFALAPGGNASRECLRAAAGGGTAHVLCTASMRGGGEMAIAHRLASLSCPDGKMADIPGAAMDGAAGYWWNGGRQLDDVGLLRALQLAAAAGLPVVAEPRITNLANGAELAEGARSARLGLTGLQEVAETAAIAKLAEFAAHTRCKMHFAGLSCARAVQIIEAAQQCGTEVTADVHAANVLLSEDDEEDFGTQPRPWPPLRSAIDRAALATGLVTGSIASMVTAHAAMSAAGGDEPYFGAGSAYRCAGLHYQLVMKWALDCGLSPSAAAAATWKAGGAGLASIFGTGSLIRAGSPANLMLVDPKAETDSDGGQNGRMPLPPFAKIKLPAAPLLVLRGGKEIGPD